MAVRVKWRASATKTTHGVPVARLVGVVFLQLVGLLAQEPPARPITEVDVYQDMARFWTIVGAEKSVLVSGGAGYVDDGLASIDVSYRRGGISGLGDLLPTTAGISLWAQNAAGDPPLALTASLGYTLVFGLLEGPYVTANALAQWAPASSKVAAGFDVGLGYELRRSLAWSLTADVRLVRLWDVTDDAAMDTSAFGGRFTVGVRRYLDF
jgi:hypothetical protein